MVDKLDLIEFRDQILRGDPNRGGLAANTSVEEMSTDSLTGLLNRGLWEAEMNQYVREASRRHENFAIILIDLDDFKSKQDGLGHQWGDDLLRKLGQSIRDKFREEDIKGRYGGDEMIVLMEDFKVSHNKVEQKKEEISEFLSNKIESGVSVGIAVWNGNSSLKDVINDADKDLYKVKKLKKKNV